MTRSALQMGRLTLVLCLLLQLVLITQACFLGNCLNDGERDVDGREAMRPCKYCSFGQCVGPQICCGDRGCEMGSEEANKCREEDEDSTPCQVFGWPCILNNPGNIHGKCVGNRIGICCVTDTCAVSSTCQKE
uniref:Ctr_120_T conopeptide n=1 Tax=Conus tribblei TaxID=101761 RepID=A0A0C9S5X0_CONTD